LNRKKNDVEKYWERVYAKGYRVIPVWDDWTGEVVLVKWEEKAGKK